MTDYFYKIKNDESIIEIYNKIHEYEDEMGGYVNHD